MKKKKLLKKIKARIEQHENETEAWARGAIDQVQPYFLAHSKTFAGILMDSSDIEKESLLTTLYGLAIRDTCLNFSTCLKCGEEASARLMGRIAFLRQQLREPNYLLALDYVQNGGKKYLPKYFLLWLETETTLKPFNSADFGW